MPWLDSSDATTKESCMEHIRAEMVANVWKVVVHEGDDIKAGDTLVILESMKMEIPVVSEVAGKVGKVAVREGDVVQEGDLIADVDGA
jgi:biotin carboxyl carrier protein